MKILHWEHGGYVVYYIRLGEGYPKETNELYSSKKANRTPERRLFAFYGDGYINLIIGISSSFDNPGIICGGVLRDFLRDFR